MRQVEVVQVHRHHKHRKAEEQHSQLVPLAETADLEEELGHHTAQHRVEFGEQELHRTVFVRTQVAHVEEGMVQVHRTVEEHRGTMGQVRELALEVRRTLLEERGKRCILVDHRLMGSSRKLGVLGRSLDDVYESRGGLGKVVLGHHRVVGCHKLSKIKIS